MLTILLFFLLAGPSLGRIAEDLMVKEEPPLPAPVPPPPPPPAPSAPPASPPPVHSCWSAPRDLCPEGPLGCARIDQSSVLCCDVDSFRLKEGLAAEMNQTILYLHILNATLDELNVSQPIWRRLISMSITDGNIKEIVGEFLRNSPASCLNISNNGIQSITAPRALVNLYKLTTLDMSKNNLKVMPNFNGRQSHFALDIKGNNEMLCKSVLDALERYSKGHLNFINVNTTFCTSSKTFHWFNTTELVPIRQVEVIHELQYDCPDVSSGGVKCQCNMVRVDIVPGKPPTFSVGVDCSNRQLKELPHRLPPNTIQLNVSYNNITSLAPLSNHPSYEQMRELYADYNNIQSIVELEGTKFIDNFMILSLRANKLKSLPTYILSNTFDRNLYAKTIHLANNHLHCDCTSAKVLRVWLIDKTKYIPDYDQIYCENNPARVIDLVETKMCQQQRDWTDYIFYVIALEILLLLGLVTKVTYDYWVFKSAGYLPWPASKMPKLPCDWLCE